MGIHKHPNDAFVPPSYASNVRLPTLNMYSIDASQTDKLGL